MIRRSHKKTLVAIWAVLLPLLAGAIPARAQDLKKLATDLAARIHSVGRNQVTVVDFVDLDRKPNKLGKFLGNQLQSALAEPELKLVVVDQSQTPQLLEQMEKLDEGLLDKASGQKLGKMMGTEVLIVGTVMPSSLSVRLDIKAIDLQTAKVITGGSTSVTRFGLIDRLASEANGEGSEDNRADSSTERSGGSPQPAVNKASSRPPARSRVDQGVTFDLGGCSLSGEDLSCVLTITSDNHDRWIAVSLKSRAWNDSGEEHGAEEVVIANTTSKYDCARKEILKSIPTRVNITFPQFGSENTTVERLRLSWQEEANGCPYSGWRPVDFEKIEMASGAMARNSPNGRTGTSGAGGKGGGLLQRLQDRALEILDKTIDNKTRKLTGEDEEKKGSEKKPPNSPQP